MAKRAVVKLTANFERNLEDIERFLAAEDIPQAFDHLLDELLVTVISNLERFPEMGRPFLSRRPGSVETTNGVASLRSKLSALTKDPEALREVLLAHYLVLYAQIDGAMYLLAIRHQRQLSFDFAAHGR